MIRLKGIISSSLLSLEDLKDRIVVPGLFLSYDRDLALRVGPKKITKENLREVLDIISDSYFSLEITANGKLVVIHRVEKGFKIDEYRVDLNKRIRIYKEPSIKGESKSIDEFLRNGGRDHG